jgi:dimethylargininase
MDSSRQRVELQAGCELIRAITRAVGARLADCLLTFREREPIDLAKARVQHAAYDDALRRAGAAVEVLPADDELPDSVFVEDTAVVFDEAAVMTRPGTPVREREVPAIEAALARYRELQRITAPATLEGGDVLRVGREFYVGITSRTNGEGFEQFASIVRGFGYRAIPVEVRGCLHLKSAVTALDEKTLLLNPSWLDVAALPRIRHLAVPEEEPFGANALVVNGVVHLSARWRRTRLLVEDSLCPVTAIDVSELEKAEGALTCSSLIFST